ncbi:CcmD family protein [Aquirufa ecclesiirivi]|uniref:CcmD family protein n=1 Tax=Aquirufa ecclesiirivi TaxID=2715124 RepID=A0ABT4JK21_9BACT|nr:CcmD family protein [Aquirufa ecclesiirivi]MCZ2471794.1 CcmD family protein [Aquirufa ecclesiirivi]MCZ2476189.1 CcmD family protein [Aquirufa ecclesiirivi]MDF0693507.1 CcmD family protein [Aquirufa ecclesiirivi]NHC49414.1 CcmD family protein [Aquirufa ecclesiirivi]
MKTYILTLLFSLTSFLGLAQSEIEMADKFRADGKIYVVIAVVLVILIGLFIYLMSLDKKVSALEKDIKNK